MNDNLASNSNNIYVQETRQQTGHESNEVKTGKITDKLNKRYNLTKSEIWGLVLAVLAIVIACFNYHYGFFNTKTTTGRPGFMSGLFAFIFTAILYWRGLLAFSNDNNKGRLLSIVVNVTVFATLFSLMFHAIPGWQKDIFFIVVMTVCITSIMFGMKGIAKMVMILSLLILSIKSLSNLEKAMGIWGFVYIVLVFTSFYLQGNVNFSGLRDELKLLYDKATYTIKEAGKEASSDLETVGGELKRTVSSKITK